MPTPAPDAWISRDQPVLYAAAQVPSGRVDEIAPLAGLSEKETMESLARLAGADPPYLVGLGTSVGSVVRVTRVTERGLRTTGVWPSDDDAQAFLRLIQTMVDRAELEERSRWERLRDAANSVDRQMLVTVLGALITKQF